ncbi:MAG: hydroxysqualene dehydroxylase HpnE [Bdellovibrionota bacterium]
MPSKSVLVVGSGLAGLTAAVHLSRKGHRVTLAEQKKFLGGRTYSFQDKQTGEVVDNGQHVLTTTYDSLLELLEIIGTRDKVCFPDRLQTFFQDPKHGSVWLRAPKLPGPLAPLGGILGMWSLPSIPLIDKLTIFQTGARLAPVLLGSIPKRLDTITAEEWFGELGIPLSVRRAFWYPFTIGTLNEKPDRVSAHLLAQLLRWGFVRRGKPASLGYPTTDLGTLFVDPSARFVEKHGGKILTGTTVVNVETDGKKIAGILCKDGTRLEADAYVLALPGTALAKMIEKPPLSEIPFFHQAKGMEDAPIVGVNLWFDKPLGTGNSYDGLLDSPIEWVFDRTKMHGKQKDGRYYYALIVSASWDLMKMSNTQILELALDEVRRFYPEARDFKLLHGSVVKEPTATFSGTPGFEKKRLPNETPLKNLFLAGDWTKTDLPSTMESAARSGKWAAEAAAKYLG